MKTTMDISDPLLDRARQLATQRGSTLRAIVEDALRAYLAESQAPDPPFRLRRCTFAGNGLQPGIDEGDWSRIRDLAYEGRGG